MLRNYFKVAVRNLLKNKLYSFINIFGLTIGMACFILIGLYIQYEMSFDRQHDKTDRIYRVAQRDEGDVFRGQDRFALTPAPLTPTLKEEFPEVEAATTLLVYDILLGNDEEVFYEQGLFSDEFVFDVFTFPIIEGEGAEALKDPNNIILTSALAEKHFPYESPIGKTLKLQNDRLLTVRGVVENVPKNQHFSFDYMTSLKNLPWYDEEDVWYSNTSWYSNNYYTYTVIRPDYDYRDLEEKLVLIDQKVDAQYFPGDRKPSWFLQPLKDIHLHSHINFEISANSDIRYVYLFGCLGLIILLLASINYMNLATARSATRATEVGMRKVLGARKRQLVYQLLGESFLLSLVSFCAALSLVNMLLPALNRILDQEIPFSFPESRWMLLATFLAAIFTGGLSGLYPAVFLSGATPVKALKGGFLKDRDRGVVLRNLLVIGQFSAAIVLAIGSIVVYQQLRYIQHKKLGYNRDQVLYIPYRQTDIHSRAATIREELMKHPQVNNVSVATYMPLNMNSQGTVTNWEGKDGQDEFQIYRNYIDPHFIELFEMEVVEGRNFSVDFPTDTTTGYILNEKAVKALGWESAIGKEFDRGKVVGVVKDFHFQPFNLAIEPTYLRFRNSHNSSSGNIAVKLSGGSLENAILHIQQTLKVLAPEVPFDHHFMDQSYNQLYGYEKRVSQAFTFFTFIAVFIACMGLFGLVAHHVLQRTKEIGIRKVLGATVTNIVTLLSKDFLKLIAIAALIAFPIAWYGANAWLKDFAYRIDVDGWVFAVAGILAVAIAIMTISFQSIRAALANPIEALRNE